MRLTDSKIKAIRRKPERFILWEDGGTGLGVRVSPAGRKTFIWMYRFNGKPRMMTLGAYPRVGLATARLKAAQAREKLHQGQDPGEELLQTKARNRTALTIEGLANEFIELWSKPRKKSWKEDERILKKDIISEWGRRKAKDIKRRDIILLLDEIVERGAPIQANRALAVIRKMLNFGVERGILEATPCVSIRAPAKENRKDRVLNETEIKGFWRGLANANMADTIKLALKFQLITAQRKGEAATAEWADFDLKGGWWTIPGEKSKNGLPHRVPLSALAKEILGEVKRESGGSPWLFPSNRTARHITRPAIDHALRKNIKKFKFPVFTPHDLRRSAASHLASLGTSRLVVKKILNHAEPDVTATYDRHGYDREKRMALEAWGRKLKAIITGKKGKVIQLKN